MPLACTWQSTGLTHSRTLLPMAADLLRNSGLALEDMAAQWIEDADVPRADALGELHALDFFFRLSAYQKALAEKDAGESGGEG